MVWQAANLCQQTSHKSHVNKRQFSAKWHPWWLLLQPKGVERNHRVVDQQLYTYLILKSDQSYNCSPCNGSCWWSEKSFLFSHRYVCHWSYYCTQNLSFYFGEMSLKPKVVSIATFSSAALVPKKGSQLDENLVINSNDVRTVKSSQET